MDDTAHTALVEQVRDFVRDTVIPIEEQRGARAHGASPEDDDRVRTQLQDAARTAGLLSPHLPERWGGRGLTMRAQADVFEAAG